jgi:hypothetical protein
VVGFSCLPTAPGQGGKLWLQSRNSLDTADKAHRCMEGSKGGAKPAGRCACARQHRSR